MSLAGGDETWLQILPLIGLSEDCAVYCSVHSTCPPRQAHMPCVNKLNANSPGCPPITLLHSSWLISRPTPLTPLSSLIPQAPGPRRPCTPDPPRPAASDQTQPAITFKGNHLACAPGPFSLRYAYAYTVAVAVLPPFLLLFTVIPTLP